MDTQRLNSAKIFCCQCGVTPNSSHSSEFQLLDCGLIICPSCCRHSDTDDGVVWCNTDQKFEKNLRINSEVQASLFRDPTEILHDAFQHYQFSAKQYDILCNLICERNIPTEAEIIKLKQRVQELSEKNRLNNKAEIKQKLKDDLIKMKRGFQKCVVNYNKQKEAERNNQLTVTMRQTNLETEPLRKQNLQLFSRLDVQNSASTVSDRFGKLKTSTPISQVIGSRTGVSKENLTQSAGYNSFRNSLIFKGDTNS